MIAALGWPTRRSVRHAIFSRSSWVIPMHGVDGSDPWEMGFQNFFVPENQGLEGALALNILQG